MSEFDELQEAWQRQGSTSHVKIESEALLKLVRRGHKEMEGILLRRDFMEVVIALLMIPVWIWLGETRDLPWSWYLVIPGLLWIAGFLIIDRRTNSQERPEPGDSLRESVVHSMAQLNHQISLLTNILWWYILPVAGPLAIYAIHDGYLSRAYWGIGSALTFFGLVFWFIYELNQRAVRKTLEPQRDELQEFLDALDSTESETSQP